MRPRLLVLASTYPRWLGDPEPGFVHELAKRLVHDFEVTVVGPHAQGAPVTEILEGVRVVRYRYAPTRFETLVNDGGIVTNLKRAPWKWLLVPGFLVAQMWAAWRVMQRWRPHVVHAHWLLPQGLMTALLQRSLRSGPNFLVTSHGADLYALRGRVATTLKRWVVSRAGAVTVVSSAMREELERQSIDVAKVSVQPMGVDLRERFTPDPGVVRSNDEILFVGRLVEKKGLRCLIDAMPMILEARPTARLTIAGFGPEEGERRAHVLQLGLQDKVRFLGAVGQADLPALYQRAAVLAAPFIEAASGDREGLGLVVVEAAGCGCPVVVSELPAVRDVFAHDEASLVAPGDVAALAAACLHVLQGDPENSRRRAARCRERLLQRFDWTAQASAYASLLRQLVP